MHDWLPVFIALGIGVPLAQRWSLNLLGSMWLSGGIYSACWYKGLTNRLNNDL